MLMFKVIILLHKHLKALVFALQYGINASQTGVFLGSFIFHYFKLKKFVLKIVKSLLLLFYELFLFRRNSALQLFKIGIVCCFGNTVILKAYCFIGCLNRKNKKNS